MNQNQFHSTSLDDVDNCLSIQASLNDVDGIDNEIFESDVTQSSTLLAPITVESSQQVMQSPTLLAPITVVSAQCIQNNMHNNTLSSATILSSTLSRPSRRKQMRPKYNSQPKNNNLSTLSHHGTNRFMNKVVSLSRTTIQDDFAQSFFESEVTSNKNSKQNELEIDSSGRFKSITCPICNTMPTQHRCLFEMRDGITYNDKRICGEPFCSPCGSIWGCEGGPMRCRLHMNLL